MRPVLLNPTAVCYRLHTKDFFFHSIQMKRFILLLFFLLFTGPKIIAQELQCKVNLTLTTLSEEERKVWETFKQDAEAYLNAYSWTTNFTGERIQATINFNIIG